jgi:hypothetical protein
MGATTGQILKWNGTTWVPSLDSGKVYKAGLGIAISNDSIINLGDRDSSNDIVIGSNAGGDLAGTYPNPTIGLGKVVTDRIADGAITANKLNQMGATSGQILKWNGTAWVPSLDSGKVYKAGLGIAISNDSIINTGDQDSTDDVLKTTQFNGDVSGTYNTITIKNGAVTTAKIADGAVTAAKLNQMGATTGQILKWNGTTWVPSLDSGKVYKAGLGIAISNDSIINLGDRDSSNDIVIGSNAGGDLAGTYPNPTIGLGKVVTDRIADGAVKTPKIADGAITANKLNQMGATSGQILKWNGSAWEASNDIGKFYFAGRGIRISNDSIINTGDTDSTDDVSLNLITTKGDVIGKFDSLYIRDGAVTSGKIALGSVSGNKLSRMGATDGQVLTWDQAGNVWTPKNSNFSFFATSRDITSPNNTVPAHQIIPVGTESNIDFVIAPKGTGAIIANLPISGNNDKRGQRAVDLQMQRSNADEVAKGPNSVIAGGRNNKITSAGTLSVIAGGFTNSISGSTAAIVGGQLNTASGIYSFIGGGNDNDAIGDLTSVSGGQFNIASSQLSFIGGGDNNSVYGSNGSIVGGQSNSIVSGTHGFIGSGLTNSLSGTYGVITGGRLNRVSGTNGFIGGGERDTITGNYSVIAGGQLNKVSANYASIHGGFENQALAEFATINGGDSNIITSAGYGGVIGGGILNRVADFTATVAGGISNQALGRRSTVGGGITNTARNWYSTVSGGAGNSALAEGSAVFGGIEMVLDTTAIGSFGFNGNIINNSTSLYVRRINIAQPRTGVFNNVHLWLTNNDDTVRTLRFYEKYNVQGAFPNGTNYVGFKAPDLIGSDMIYTLPSTAPSANGQVLSSTTAGVLSWVNGGGNTNDFFQFIDFNNGQNSAIQAHAIIPFGAEDDIDFVAMPKGKGSFMFDYPDNSATGGAKRGLLSIDLQMVRTTQHQVVKADTASILGGFSNEISNSAHTSVIIGGAFNKINAYQSTILGGRSNTTDGQFSMVGGLGNTAGSFGETVLGIYATDAGGTTSSSVATDRLFAIGNGTSASRSTAFSILKNGNTNVSGTLDINGNATIGGGSSTSELRLKEASGTGSNYVGLKAGNATADMVYTLPTSAPSTDGQVLVSTTNGTMSWSNPILKSQNISVNPGNLLQNGGSESIAVTVTGAQVGATVQVSPRTEMEDGIIIGYARVSAANTISIRFVNTTNSAVDPASVNVDITVIQP